MLSRVEVLVPLEVLEPIKPRYLTGEDCAVAAPLAVDKLEPPSSNDDAGSATLSTALLAVDDAAPLVVDKLEPPSSTLSMPPTALLAVDDAPSLSKEIRYQHELQTPSSSHSGYSAVTQMEWYLLTHFLH